MNGRSETRQRIVTAAAELLTRDGRDAVTTRSVSGAAGVQPPTIYRLFGDMQGLLGAVAADGFDRYLARKATQLSSGDAVDDLRTGWDLHVRFGLENPAHYLLMYAITDGGSQVEAALRANEILRGLVTRVAVEGRLTVGVERAARMVHAAGLGVTLALLSGPENQRDSELSSRVREAILAAITTDIPSRNGTDLAAKAIALRASLTDAPERLSRGEALLLDELLERLSSPGT